MINKLLSEKTPSPIETLHIKGTSRTGRFPLAEYYGLKDEYAYIMPSLERFPIGTEQVKLAQEVGFNSVIHYPILFGCVLFLPTTKLQRIE